MAQTPEALIYREVVGWRHPTVWRETLPPGRLRPRGCVAGALGCRCLRSPGRGAPRHRELALAPPFGAYARLEGHGGLGWVGVAAPLASRAGAPRAEGASRREGQQRPAGSSWPATHWWHAAPRFRPLPVQTQSTWRCPHAFKWGLLESLPWAQPEPKRTPSRAGSQPSSSLFQILTFPHRCLWAAGVNRSPAVQAFFDFFRKITFGGARMGKNGSEMGFSVQICRVLHNWQALGIYFFCSSHFWCPARACSGSSPGNPMRGQTLDPPRRVIKQRPGPRPPPLVGQRLFLHWHPEAAEEHHWHTGKDQTHSRQRPSPPG